MAGLGLVGAFGQQALRDSIKQRLQEEAAARQRAFENSIESRRMANAEQQTLQGGEQNKFNAEALAFSRGQTALNNDLTQTEKLDESTPPGFLPQDSPIAGRLVKIGAATPDPGHLGSTELGGAGTLPGPEPPMKQGTLQKIPQAAQAPGFMKRATMKQSDTATDNARQAAQLKQTGETQDWKNSIAQQLADLKAGQPGHQDHVTPVPQYDADGRPIGTFAFNTTNGTMTAVNAPGGGAAITRPAPGAGQIATQDHHKELARGTLDRLDHDIDAAASQIGPGAGRIADFEQWAGSGNPALQTLGTRMLLAKMQVDAGIGGMRAAASPQLLSRWDSLLANKVTPAGLHAAVQVMRELVSQTTARPGASSGGKATAEDLIKKYGVKP